MRCPYCNKEVGVHQCPQRDAVFNEFRALEYRREPLQIRRTHGAQRGPYTKTLDRPV